MQISISGRLRIFPTLLILAALSLMTSVMSSLLFGELILPLVAAALAALFVLERGRARVLSIVAPIFMIAADVLFRGSFSYLALEAVALAIIIALFFLRGSKAECAFWLTLTVTLFIILAMVMAAHSATKLLDLDSFFDYYYGLYRQIEDWFVETFASVSLLFGIPAEQADATVATSILRTMASVLPSVAIVFAFAVGGVALKIFSGILKLVCDEESEKKIAAWRFALPKTVYVAFWAALVLNLVLGLIGSAGVFAVAVANVYNVLLYVFAYLGFGAVVAFLSALFKSRPLAILAVVGSLLVFNSLAIDLISYFGASFVFFAGRGHGGEK